jgi:hypothetical protein
MIDDLLIFVVFVFGGAIWRMIKVKRRAPLDEHSFTEYMDAFLFPEDRQS